MPRTVATVTFDRFPEIARRLPVESGQRVEKAAIRIVAVARESMHEGKSGRAYGDHIASAPGEAPAVDLGVLSASLMHSMEGRTSAIAYTNMEYAAHLEIGTVHIEPRPFFGPAAEVVRPEFIADMADLERSLK